MLDYVPVLETLEERYRTLQTKSGGMGRVHIALDRVLAKALQSVDRYMLPKCKGIDPDGMKANGAPVEFTREDRIRIALHIISGTLDEARKLRNSTIAAVKVIRPELSRGRALEAFRYEASVWLRTPRHPNIVQLHEIVLLPTQLALVLEYVDGGTLSDLIARAGPLPLARALEIALDICRGMEYLHFTLGIVHRDLTPRNILLSLDGTAKVTDFGLAKAKSDTGTVGTAADGGTPGYMSPEQKMNPKSADERSDIYAFGVVLREMVSGCRLTVAPADDPGAKSRFSRGFDAIVRRCLAPDRDHRFGSFREVAAAVLGLASQMGITFPLAAYTDLNPELSLMKWCQVVCSDIESFPPRDIADDACRDSVGSIIRHSIIGGHRVGKNVIVLGGKLGTWTLGPAAETGSPSSARGPATTDVSRVARWVRAFGALPQTAVDWNRMADPRPHVQEISDALSSEGITFLDWYRRGLGLIALGCYEESVECFERVISGTADDGLAWNPQGRTEYGPACLGKGLALIQLGRKLEAAATLAACVNARFYPPGIQDSYLGDIPMDDREVPRKGWEIEAVRRACELCR